MGRVQWGGDTHVMPYSYDHRPSHPGRRREVGAFSRFDPLMVRMMTLICKLISMKSTPCSQKRVKAKRVSFGKQKTNTNIYNMKTHQVLR